jgi:uncharacterized protein (DUF736 family)
MSVIGTFSPSRDGGWIGTIRTLTLDARVRFVPNDSRETDRAPAFRVMIAGHRIGDAWAARSKAEPPRDYLRVRLDDPGLPGPITAALFPHDGGETANLVWSRKGRG